MKKNLILLIISVLLIFSLCSCEKGFLYDIFGNENVQDTENPNTDNGSTDKGDKYDEEYFTTALSSVTSDTAIGVYADDYDFDGIYEAYVLTCSEVISEDEAHSEGISLWFVKQDTVKLLCENGDFYLTPQMWEFSDKILFCIDRYVDGTDFSNVFFVSGNGAYSYGEFSARLERTGESDEFVAFVSASDTVYKVASHSYQGKNSKPYYLYFDGNFFCEYAGLLISAADLKAYSGAEEILNSIYSGGYTMGDIFYRSNGIININISKDGTAGTVLLENVTLKVSGDNVQLLTKDAEQSAVTVSYDAQAAASVIENKFSETERFSYGGLYAEVAFPGIAVYPESFK